MKTPSNFGQKYKIIQGFTGLLIAFFTLYTIYYLLLLFTIIKLSHTMSLWFDLVSCLLKFQACPVSLRLSAVLPTFSSIQFYSI